MKLTKRWVLCLLVLSVLLVPLAVSAAPDTGQKAGKIAYEYYVTGNSGDVTTATTPGLVLMGGGTDVDAAFEWMIGKAGGGDFVVIRATGTDAYNPYIFDLGVVDSVETLIIKTRAAANDTFVLDKIANAEALWIAGGDQKDYITFWKGTPVEAAINNLAGRVPIGGTSAGLAVLSEYVFSSMSGTVTSAQALANPYNRYMTFDRDFLVLPNMQGIIADQHLVTRDRMGRLVTFMARIVQDGWATEAKGIGVDERTAVLVEANGSAIVVGSGKAYFLGPSGTPEKCVSSKRGTPLIYRNVPVYRLAAGVGSFDLPNWSGSDGTAYTLTAEGGVLSSTQPGGGIY